MGQIVAAMVSCHTPALFLRQPGEDQRNSTPQLPQRFMRDMDAVLADYELCPSEITAVKTLEPPTVAKAGAHRILAWSAVHLIAADMRT